MKRRKFSFSVFVFYFLQRAIKSNPGLGTIERVASVRNGWFVCCRVPLRSGKLGVGGLEELNQRMHAPELSTLRIMKVRQTLGFCRNEDYIDE